MTAKDRVFQKLVQRSQELKIFRKLINSEKNFFSRHELWRYAFHHPSQITSEEMSDMANESGLALCDIMVLLYYWGTDGPSNKEY